MKHTYCLALVILAVPSVSCLAAEFVLTDSIVGPAPIVVFKNAPPRTRDAAMTLADYIEKISGVRRQVIDGKPKLMPARAIWVGVQPVVKALFPKLDFEFQHPEETLIAASEKHLVIALAPETGLP